MLLTQFFLPLLKETPSDAELISHQLMLRAGMIRKLASGLYSWLPLGFRVVRKVEHIVREEMNRAGAQEMLMPSVHPGELWEESGRWKFYGPELLRFKDRHDRDFCYGPTHEEVITDIARREVNSYKQLPLNLYQIQTKFRDEIRPRFGVMRAREFIMKDAYSFDIDEAGMQIAYQKMFDAYVRIFTRLGLNFRAVLADTGTIGGNFSHEFQVIANSGEDCLAYSDQSDYAANLERAESQAPQGERPKPGKALEKIATPQMRTIEDLAVKMNLPANKSVKTLIVKGKDKAHPLIALILRGDHQLNTIKAEKCPQVHSPLEFSTPEEIQLALRCTVGSIGPVNLKIPFIVDRDAAHLSDFVCGANEDDYHYIHVNWERDVALSTVADLRNVVEGDVSPDGKGHLKLMRGIEVGHVFQLGDKYSQLMSAQVLDEQGKSIVLKMGCYGIGITRIVAAAIEQNHDKQGIIWPESIAPFQIALIPIRYHQSDSVRRISDEVYQALIQAGFEVLLDDRKERPGVMFATVDLIGIPHRLVMSEQGIADGKIEYKRRSSEQVELIDLESLLKNPRQLAIFRGIVA